MTNLQRKERAYCPSGEVGQHIAKAHDLQQQIQSLEAEYKLHRDWLLTHMRRQQLTLVELGPIKAHLKVRHKWTYSAETQRDMAALQITQKWEASHGVAEDSPTYYVALTTKEPK